MLVLWEAAAAERQVVQSLRRTNFESIEALWAKALALDLETDPVNLDASFSAALAAFTCLACFLSSSDQGGPLPRPLFWPSPPIASATLVGLKKGCHTQKSCNAVGFGLGFDFAFRLGRDQVGPRNLKTLGTNRKLWPMAGLRISSQKQTRDSSFGPLSLRIWRPLGLRKH